MKPNGFEYYEYLVVYVDDILVLSHHCKEVMQMIENAYHIKDLPTKPEIYFVANILEWRKCGQ